MVIRELSTVDGMIFRDEEKLHPEYVPRRLVNREEEFRKLVRLFKPLLQKGTSQRALICGAGGSGKTALGRRFARELEAVSKGKSIDLETVYVDCRRFGKDWRIGRKITQSNGISVPRRGISTVEYLEALKKHMEENEYRLLVIFDWIDFYIRQEGSDLLYSLTRLWENPDEPNRLSLLGISRIPDLSGLLDAATSSSFLHNRIKLDSYSGSEIKQILRKRADQAFRPGVVREETLELIADKSRYQDGAGFALEWLLRAGNIASESNDREVGPEHALEGKARVHVRTPVELLKALNKHQLLLLLAYAERAKNGPKKPILTGELREKYEKVCRSYGEKPLGHTKISELIDEFSNLRLLETRMTGKGIRGCSRKIKIPGASPWILRTVLERFLEKQNPEGCRN